MPLRNFRRGIHISLVQIVTVVTVSALHGRNRIRFILVAANDLGSQIHRQQCARTGNTATGTGHALQ